jgi:hypothetical protein
MGSFSLLHSDVECLLVHYCDYFGSLSHMALFCVAESPLSPHSNNPTRYCAVLRVILRQR